jgi:1-acyl-sn-glycerol-3-phosphate acyltransferase
MIVFVIHHTVIDVMIWSEKFKLRYFLISISLTARLGLKILNIKVSHQGIRGEVTQRLIVANHLSYLDVLIFSAFYPSLFVTSMEIRETFLLGRICKLAGCFFVERRKELRDTETKFHELQQMKDKFFQGHNIFLFPEGTSSDGNRVLPFKNSFFQLAVDSQTPVVPMCLKYIGSNADVSPWYGDMTFVDHLLRVCVEPGVNARLTVLDELIGDDRITLADKAYVKISESYERH